jgi:VanZ family protein
MAIIFCASSDQGSFQHSSRIVAPILNWLFPGLSAETIHSIVLGVRKCAHFTEFAILAILAYGALSKRTQKPLPIWRSYAQALLIVILYAASDEFHQLFVPTREASVVDVLIDSVGGAFGLAVAWTWSIKRFKKTK